MVDLKLEDLLGEYASAQAHTMAVVADLSADQIFWRADESSSSIGWHLGHQAAVNHYMMRNLTAAEVSFNPTFDSIFDSATREAQRDALPALDQIVDYRREIATSTQSTIERIRDGDVGAPNQLVLIAETMMRAIINHEYQHATWVAEVRSTLLDSSADSVTAPAPASQRLVEVDGYWMLA